MNLTCHIVFYFIALFRHYYNINPMTEGYIRNISITYYSVYI